VGEYAKFVNVMHAFINIFPFNAAKFLFFY